MTAQIINFKTKIVTPANEVKCSFCGKSKKDVRSLVANADNSRHICDQCTKHCVALVAQYDSNIAIENQSK